VQRALGGQGGRQCRWGGGEGGAQAVALSADDVAAVRGDRLAQQREVPIDGRAHGRGAVLPATGAALDVRVQITARFRRIGEAMAAGKVLPPLELYKRKRAVISPSTNVAASERQRGGSPGHRPIRHLALSPRAGRLLRRDVGAVGHDALG
jgi:hypothetical protein